MSDLPTIARSDLETAKPGLYLLEGPSRILFCVYNLRENTFDHDVEVRDLARIHEYGFSGPETVRAHSRTIKQAFGRAISPKTVFVKEFSREMHMPERSFMRSALADKREEIKQGLADAIHEGTR